MKTEPVLLLSLVAAAIVSVAAKLHIALETSVVETALVDLGILATGLIQRSKVTPAHKLKR